MLLAPARLMWREFLFYELVDGRAEHPQLLTHPRRSVGRRRHYGSHGVSVTTAAMKPGAGQKLSAKRLALCRSASESSSADARTDSGSTCSPATAISTLPIAISDTGTRRSNIRWPAEPFLEGSESAAACPAAFDRSATLRSLLMTESRNASSERQAIRKFTLGVETKQREWLAAAALMRCSAAARSTASMGKGFNTTREPESGRKNADDSHYCEPRRQEKHALPLPFPVRIVPPGDSPVRR